MTSAYLLALRSPRPPRPKAALLIYLPGGDGTGQLFYRQLAGLEQLFDIRCLEIPNHDLTGWEQLVEQVVALVQAELSQGARPAVYLCGESFGGCLALQVIRRSPELFDHLILINPASAFKRSSWLYWPSFLTYPVPEPLYRIFWIGFLPILAALERIEPADQQTLLKAVQQMPQTTSIWRMSLLREFEFSDAQLQQIHQPTLIVASGRDFVLPSVQEADHLSRLLPQAQSLILPESGHACLLEAKVNLREILASAQFLPQTAGAAEGTTEVEASF
jgi:pimeloyl-ACP methyl ester carboxylesterase